VIDSSQLRKIATDLRIEADRRDVEHREKAAHIVKAAAGLALLRRSIQRPA
jgi:hypothetical protein